MLCCARIDKVCSCVNVDASSQVYWCRTTVNLRRFIVMNERRQACRVTPLGKVRRPQHQKCRHRAVSVSVAKAIQIAHKYKHFCCVLYEPTHRSSSLNYRRCTAMHYIFPFKATVLFVVSKLAQYSYRPLISRKAYGCVYDQYR